MENFTLDEFDCKETGENKMNPEFLELVDHLRAVCGFPFVITSGYRSEIHSAESGKIQGGTHTQGIACDIQVSTGRQRMVIVSEALKLGFNGIGVANTFVHVDRRKTIPVLWCY